MKRSLFYCLGILVAAAVLFGVSRPSLAADFTPVIDELVTKGDLEIAAYDPDNGALTGDAFSDLYFDVFEESGLEADIGARDVGLKSDLESRFSKVIGLASRGKEREAVDAAWQNLREGLLSLKLQSLSKGSPWAAFIQSFIILLREGAEALLVVLALATYLRRSGNEDKIRYLVHGVVWALVASLITAYLMAVVFRVSGAGREALEGVTMLVAAAILFYVSCWLFAKREARRWQAYVQSQVDQAISGGKALTLGFAVFLAVYREGAETVLFYQALIIGEEGYLPEILAGFIAAALMLVVVYYLIRHASMRLPLGLFFTGTAGLLYVLVVIFTGKGILELQEAGWIGITPVEGLPTITWLGVFPTMESAAAQVLILLPAVVGLLWVFFRRRDGQSQASHT